MGIVGTGNPGPPITQFTCNVSGAYTPEDNETYIGMTEFTLVDCPDIPLNQNIDFWNCNLCGGDDRYEQPIIDGDIFYLQFKTNLAEFTTYWPFVFNKDNECIAEISGQTFTTTDGANLYLNIEINASEIPTDCFYIKLIAFRDCAMEAEDIEDCVALKILEGMTVNEAIHACAIELCPDYEEYYTEQYRKTNTDCEETLLVEADYGQGYDCVGRYYGANEDDQAFVLRFRVPGTLERTDYDFEITEIFDQVAKNKVVETFRVRTLKLPPYVAVEMAMVWNSKAVLVDGLRYGGMKKLSKNNEDGRMWIIDTTLNADCERDFTCES